MLKDGQLLESRFIHFSFLLDLIEFVLWERDAVSGPILMSEAAQNEVQTGVDVRGVAALSRSAHEYTNFKVMYKLPSTSPIL